MLVGASWPDAGALAGYVDEAAELATVTVCDIVGAVRSARSRYGVSPKTLLDVVVKAPADKAQLVEAQSRLISSLAKTASLSVAPDAAKPAESAAGLVSDVEVYTVLAGLVDFEAEKQRIGKEMGKLEADAAKLEKKLSNPGFLSKAAPEVVEKDRAKLEEAKSQIERLAQQLSELG